MTVIRWSEAMSVGVSLLDADHRVLVSLINRLHESGGDEEARRATIDTVLETLVAYAAFHFEREEKVIEACGFPHIDAHKDEHQEFAQQVGDLRRQFDAGQDPAFHAELVEFLTNWLNHHILLQDKAYRPFVEGDPRAEMAAAAYGPADPSEILAGGAEPAVSGA